MLDVGGGKGLLSYLLNKNGWKSTVIDPIEEVYLKKYKDLNTDCRVLLTDKEVNSIPRIAGIFREDLTNDFDLLIGLHAHGSNLQIINACKKYNRDFVLLPCCVIDEPLTKRPNIDWLKSLVDFAANRGFEVKKTTLNFKGQNTLIYTDQYLTKIPTLYTITGLPYSGKTTLRKELIKHIDFELVSIDNIMDKSNMWREGHPTQDDWDKAYSVAYEQLKTYLKANEDVVFDGGSLKFSERETQRNIAKKYGARHKLIYINTPRYEIIKRRLRNQKTKERGDLTDSEMEKAFNMFEEPRVNETPLEYSTPEDLKDWIGENLS